MFCFVSCSGRQLSTRARGARSTKASTAAFFLFIPIARGDFRPNKDADGRRRGGELGSGSLIGFPPSGSRKQSSIYIYSNLLKRIHYDAIKCWIIRINLNDHAYVLYKETKNFSGSCMRFSIFLSTNCFTGRVEFISLLNLY